MEKRVTYSGYKDGKHALLWKPTDGSAGEELLTTSDSPTFPWFWSPDGKTLLYTEINPVTGWDVLMLARDGDRKPRPLLQTPFQDEWASWSPDGRWIAYNSDESGRQEVYVASFPNLGTKMRISTGGGLHPQWAPNGKELYYRTGASMESLSARAFAQRVGMMAVPIETTPTLRVGKPRELFEGPYFDSGHDYAVTPDGKGFIMIRESESQSGPNEMHVVLNWLQELRWRVPSGTN